MVETVREVPDGATVVNASDERIRNLTLVQQTVENATETGRNVTVNVTGERLPRIEKALGKLPAYSGRDGPIGNYVRKNDVVVVVYLKVEI